MTPERALEPATLTSIDEKEVRAAQDDRPVLFRMEREKLGKWIYGRWQRFDKEEERRAIELKANYLRWSGFPFVQPHPNNPGALFLPKRTEGFQPRGQNEIERACDRYVAQVMADQPVLEAIPGAGGEDEDDDAAEAATHGIRGEWQRLHCWAQLKELMQSVAIYRSGFKHYFIAPGETRKATKKEATEDGVREFPVDSKGIEVDDESLAADIVQGDLDNEILTPFQVRWSNGYTYAHDAPEVMVGRLITLRDLYELYPDTKKVPIRELVNEDIPRDMEEWLTDLSGKSGKTLMSTNQTADLPDDRATTGEQLGGEAAVLDSKVFFLIYYRRKSRTYPEGFFCHVVGNVVPEGRTSRGSIKQWAGVPPIVHYKMLWHPIDKHGRALVDVLRGEQDSLDFIHGQILRWLQSLRARYFLNTNTDVNLSDLEQQHNSYIYYSGAVPQREEAPVMPRSITDYLDRRKRSFDDKVGIHESSRGIHVPGVQSGQHVQQLKVGDETILGLTRDQVVLGIEQEGKLILQGIKTAWSSQRRIQYFGPDKDYIARALESADFEQTKDVILVPGSFLMVTPSQRTQIMANLVATKLLTPEEVKKFLPTADIGGFSLSENPHFMRARRQNSEFLAGPPPEIVKEVERLREQLHAVAGKAGEQAAEFQVGGEEEPARQSIEAVERVEQSIEAVVDSAGPIHRDYEDEPTIARIHFFEHANALSRKKVDRLPSWWIRVFEQHAELEGQMAGLLKAQTPPAPPGESPPDAQSPGAPPSQPQAIPG